MTSQVTRGYSDTSAGQAHWRRSIGAGSANPVVCLHMAPKSSRSFSALLPKLARNRIALAPDLPGHGASDPLNSAASIPGYAQWLWELLDAELPGETVDFVGYHTGAMVAVAAAQARPAAVGKLVALSAPVFKDAEIAAFREFFRPIPLDEDGSRFRIMWERIMRFRGPGMTLEMAAASLSDNLLGGEDYEEGHRAAFDHAKQFLSEISLLENPILVINVADDLEEHSRRIDPYLNNGVRRDYPHWGNGFLELHAEQLARDLLGFFNS
ncbi:hydrolase, alpha/beta fold family [gamma proteobacterium NOR5-3]|nr:hydrolase, alpha/beta fold family [gamma proteobacterium NOR5-3]